MITVDGWNALLSERKMARIATAGNVQYFNAWWVIMPMMPSPSIPDDPRVVRSAHSQVRCTIIRTKPRGIHHGDLPVFHPDQTTAVASKLPIYMHTVVGSVL